ncbi:UDP-N-acetylmuramoyl-tripeptide--D-alanyl-D-alanine ligase [Paenibacillaceae bacterium]|nr:UDP-N-acetylmuramoyl-tripeptide--D-alanyl-D-alanine ligase [Paenibacillaceae bacterium]
MIRRTIQQVADMVHGKIISLPDEAAYIAGVSIDTRTVGQGNLFIPIKGPRFNGHQFAQNAFDSGATATLWMRGEPNPPVNGAVIEVSDTAAALQSLASAYRSQLAVQVIGITGSNGKTSTKDILAALLSTTYKTQKTKGNLNNELGVPLTLLALEEDTEMAVVEMGMSGLGEIALLATMAKPDVGIITSVSEAHLGDLGSREHIIQAKLEIADKIKPDGVLIYNSDNPLFLRHLDKLAGEKNNMPALFSFGETSANRLYPVAWQQRTEDVRFSVSDPACPEIVMPLIGKHQIMNALGAIAAAHFLGVPYAKMNKGFAALQATGMRTEIIRKDGYAIINDTYKSNPASVRAALELFYDLEGWEKKIVVLGDMVDLGEETAELHRQIGARLDGSKVDKLFTVGESGALIAEAAGLSRDNVEVCANVEELLQKLPGEMGQGILLLVKGSRALRLETVVHALTEPQTPVSAEQ